MTNRTAQTSPRFYARLAGALFLISIVAGGFGELYVPDKLVVSGDPAATARNFVELDSLFRLGFASYLVEAVCDVALALLLYVLLRPVHSEMALLAAFLGLVSTSAFAFGQLFYFAPAFMLGSADYLKSFSPDQVNSLVVLCLKFSGYGGGLFFVFYGIASVLRGYLIFRSGYLPKFLGVLLALGGLGFVIRNFALVLAPQYASDFFFPPMIIAMLALGSWLVLKAVDMTKWDEKGRLLTDGAA